MKKKELILDFTSLLDVIMIVLFLVLGSAGLNAAKAQDEAEKSKAEAESVAAENASLVAQKTETDEKLAQASERLEELEEKMKSVVSADEYSELSLEYDSLRSDYEYLKLVSEYGADDSRVYETVIDRTGKVILYCNTGEDEDGAVFSLYKDTGNGEFSMSGTFSIGHDLGMDSGQRKVYKSEMINSATQFLLEQLRDDKSEMLWFSIYYDYDDVGISSFDMEVMQAAIDNLELRFDKRCYYIKFKTTNEGVGK